MTGLCQAWRTSRAEVIGLIESDALIEADIAGALGWMKYGVAFIFPRDGNGVKRQEYDLGNGMRRRVSVASSAEGLMGLSGLIPGDTESIAAMASEAGGW